MIKIGKKLIKPAALAIILTAVLVVTGGVLVSGQAEPAGGPAESPKADAPAFLLKTHNGVIALYTGDFGGAPDVVTDIEVGTLREYDRKLLEEGIEAETYEDILRLLEDFSS